MKRSVALLLVLAAWSLSGCISNQPGSNSLASVEIGDATPDRIRAVAVQVFEDAYYKLEASTADGMTFTRAATQKDKVLFGSFGNDAMRIRVETRLEPSRRNAFLLRADGFVMDMDMPGNDTKISKLAGRPYQELLNRVKTILATSGSGHE